MVKLFTTHQPHMIVYLRYMVLKIIEKEFSVCKVKDYTETDFTNEYIFTAKTDEENSLVCPYDAVPENTVSRDDGWCAFRIEGILDFSLIGILANISSVLASERIGIFAVSTYNTDYIFVKKDNFNHAVSALVAAGYEITTKLWPYKSERLSSSGDLGERSAGGMSSIV